MALEVINTQVCNMNNNMQKIFSAQFVVFISF